MPHRVLNFGCNDDGQRRGTKYACLLMECTPDRDNMIRWGEEWRLPKLPNGRFMVVRFAFVPSILANVIVNYDIEEMHPAACS